MKASKEKCSPEGAGIRKFRLKAELTQEGLAHRVGVTTHTIWRLEKDPTFNPRLDTIRAIAKALGVDIMYLLSPGSPKR
ncbi:MAG TPA: helix-turn-helix transcriptional regulator [Candidatus Dormibacteraeota bacterium]|nr:helix-turn-helix transcriptional regulator [Candidatus Dormibacteraeota bacterium]